MALVALTSVAMHPLLACDFKFNLKNSPLCTPTEEFSVCTNQSSETNDLFSKKGINLNFSNSDMDYINQVIQASHQKYMCSLPKENIYCILKNYINIGNTSQQSKYYVKALFILKKCTHFVLDDHTDLIWKKVYVGLGNTHWKMYEVAKKEILNKAKKYLNEAKKYYLKAFELPNISSTYYWNKACIGLGKICLEEKKILEALTYFYYVKDEAESCRFVDSMRSDVCSELDKIDASYINVFTQEAISWFFNRLGMFYAQEAYQNTDH